MVMTLSFLSHHPLRQYVTLKLPEIDHPTPFLRTGFEFSPSGGAPYVLPLN